MYRILIVEDDKDIRGLITDTLQRKGYATRAAGDGFEALELFKAYHADLIVSDIMMPHLDGFNLVREIRKTSNVPIIFLSARNDDVDKILGLGIGADDYIIKPVNINELVARIEAQLRRHKVYDTAQDNLSSEIVKGCFQLDEEKCELRKYGSEVKLLAKEFKLMAFLIKNTDRVFTKKQLYNAVWGDEYCFDDNTITVTLSRLRGKIETGDEKYIYTIRGLGYKFSLKSSTI